MPNKENPQKGKSTEQQDEEQSARERGLKKMGIDLGKRLQPEGVLEWKTDDDIEKEVKRIFSKIHNKLVKYADDEEVKKIQEMLNKTSAKLVEYETDKNKKKTNLYEALSAVQSASNKMEGYSQIHPTEKDIWYGALAAIGMYSVIFWPILHFVVGYFWSGGMFYVDLFFVSVIGAFASSIIYLGARGTAKTTGELLAKLATSPIVAVVLVVILSELTIGVGTGSLSAGVTPEIGALTLRDASNGMKIAFGFLFAFFSDAAIELLKSLVQR